MKNFFSKLTKKKDEKKIKWEGDSVKVDYISQNSFSKDPSTIDALIKIKTKPIMNKKERVPVGICIVLDVSGSMSGSAIDNAKGSINYVLENIGNDDLVSLVTYSNESEVVFQNKRKKDMKNIKNTVNELHANGGTNLMSGVECAVKVLKQCKLQDKHILLFTDGMVNVGITNKDTIYDRVKTIKVEEKITINSFGLGSSYDEILIKEIAQKCSGIYYYIEDSTAIKRKFGNAFELLTSIVARNVVLKMTGLNGTELIKTYGITDENFSEISLGSLFADDCRNYLIQLKIAPQEEKPYFRYEVTGEFSDGKSFKFEKEFQMEICPDKNIKFVKEIQDRRTILEVIEEEGKYSKDLMEFGVAMNPEKIRDKAMTDYLKLKERLESIKDEYDEANFFYKQLEVSIKKIENREFGIIAKQSSYTSSYSYQTTKSYI